MHKELPQLRSHERIDFKRCQKKWYWAWRRGYVPRAKSFGALDLGIWMHAALAAWYGVGTRRNGDLQAHFAKHANAAIVQAQQAGAPDEVLGQAEELAALGEVMASEYQKTYGSDLSVNVLASEVPLEFVISERDGTPIAVHKLKPDLIYADDTSAVWLQETKTATTIRTGHLPIDDQARPYITMAERALRKKGIIKPYQDFKGVMYNFLRKGVPDDRERDAQGRALNKDGTVSKRQTAPLFRRHPVRLSNKAKLVALRRLRTEALIITSLTMALRRGDIDPGSLLKTPHYSCEKFCPFFAICVAEEQGINTREMERSSFIRRNPYLYDEDNPSTSEITSFELG